MITKNLIKFALLFCLIGLTACDNKLNPGFDPDDYEPIVPPEPVRTRWMQWLVVSELCFRVHHSRISH